MDQTGQEPRVIFSADGSPFKTAAAAQAHITRKGLDASRWIVEQRGEGYVIVGTSGDVVTVRTQESANAARERISAPSGDAYYKVRFHPKANKNDDDDVHIGVNGEVWQIRRNVLVIVPARCLEAADHGVHQHFLIEPGKDRKVQFEVVTYPYDMLGTATKEEYRRFVRTGECSLNEEKPAA